MSTVDDALADDSGGPLEPGGLSGISGDPLLKRLVDLAHLGWSRRIVLFSNGQVISGALISPAQFRAALAASIREGSEGQASTGMDELVASVVDAEDPPVPDATPAAPEPRFIHLADVRIGVSQEPLTPFMRLRLPAASGFWISPGDEPHEER